MKTFYLLLSDGKIQAVAAESIMDTPTEFDDRMVVAAANSMQGAEGLKDALLSKENYSVDPDYGLKLVA